ncbi:unnamed protein product [Closterium sp. NIES-65]|nr:unnamed protein product [Closterium sp. NIES-65]
MFILPLPSSLAPSFPSHCLPSTASSLQMIYLLFLQLHSSPSVRLALPLPNPPSCSLPHLFLPSYLPDKRQLVQVKPSWLCSLAAMLPRCHAPSLPCSLAAMLPRCHAPSLPCSLAAMHPRCHAPSLPCSLAAMLPRCHAPSLPCSLAAMLPRCHAPSLLCFLAATPSLVLEECGTAWGLSASGWQVGGECDTAQFIACDANGLVTTM